MPSPRRRKGTRVRPRTPSGTHSHGLLRVRLFGASFLALPEHGRQAVLPEPRYSCTTDGNKGMSKIMVSLPEEVVRDIDEVARQRSMSRSALPAARVVQAIASDVRPDLVTETGEFDGKDTGRPGRRTKRAHRLPAAVGLQQRGEHHDQPAREINLALRILPDNVPVSRRFGHWSPTARRSTSTSDQSNAEYRLTAAGTST